MTHWVAKYVGRQWDPIGDGDSTFNCWTFVQHIQRHYYKRELPDVPANAIQNTAVARAIADESSSVRWLQVSTPQEGDCVLLARSAVPVHVGVWVRAGVKSGVLHCARGLGVTHQNLLDLRASGWGKLSFYRWNENE